MSNKTILVVGASGLVGNAIVQELASHSKHRVIGLSRRKPAQTKANVEFLLLDLLDRKACEVAAEKLLEVTHIIYAAVNETAGDLVASWTDPHHAGRNGQMLENLVEPLLKRATHLRQIVLMHGTKAYATHLADSSPTVPLRESLPRPSHDDFYFHQEDYLWSLHNKVRNRPIAWTVFRAPMITGGGLGITGGNLRITGGGLRVTGEGLEITGGGSGSNLNALLAISVMACICKEEGRALVFPSTKPSNGVMEMVDVELLARAAVWSTQAPTAKNQIFNVANGDVYSWADLWPIIARELGVPAELNTNDANKEANAYSIAETIASKAAVWSRIVKKYALQSPADWYEFLGESCALADFALNNCSRPVVTSTIKLRQAGFIECIDTNASVTQWIQRWRDQKLLPPR